MRKPPFRQFDGYLKQHAHEELSPLEQELFDRLFPAFQGTDDADRAFEKAQSDPLAAIFGPLVTIEKGERRSRRLAGYNLPRKRYSTVCMDSAGTDIQTLANELRAYRDPLELGKIEVIDLAQGCTLRVQAAEIALKAQPATAVLIHEPQRLPEKFHSLPFRQIPGPQGTPINLYIFPYHVHPARIERIIDLRYPEARDWFFETFRDLAKLSTALRSGDDADNLPTTAYSRFHFENGLAPRPDSFWAMLPTLINPDLGGGNPGDAGSTLFFIGNWLRQNQVAGLIFPAARSDAAVTFLNGAINRWQGWNLVDYRDTGIESGGQAVELYTACKSPWAWVKLPLGVKLHVAEAGTKLAGSFAIEGMVNYWADDYLGQVRALEIARNKHQREAPGEAGVASAQGLGPRAYQMGVEGIRWVRLMVLGAPAEQVNEAVLDLQGLALPYRLYPNTGRILELWSGIKQGAPSSLNDYLLTSLSVNEAVGRALKEHFPHDDFDKLAHLGADLELILLYLTMSQKAAAQGKGAALKCPPGYEQSIQAGLETPWFDEPLRNKIRAYSRQAVAALESNERSAGSIIDEGLRLQQEVYESLRLKRMAQK